jgi:hypothetical protein
MVETEMSGMQGLPFYAFQCRSQDRITDGMNPFCSAINAVSHDRMADGI